MARADKFLRKSDRAHFALCRATVKTILASYLALPPQTLSFSLGPYGKPSLPNSPISFNISHTATHACLAISRSSLPLGCDIECVRPSLDPMALASYFAPEEQRLLHHEQNASKRSKLFYQMWVRKEAVMKASGLGLLAGLDHILAIRDTVTVTADAGIKEPAWFSPGTTLFRDTEMAVAIPSTHTPCTLAYGTLSFSSLQHFPALTESIQSLRARFAAKRPLSNTVIPLT
ncbi:MAG: 4'-phosphopantetheinyl transferase superfamily protein [Desulfovibrionaceae bacterium]|nr:4'-phosphopantetheinyl transferase superfamily protein [Desulfovibrionaceae bacterium]